MSQNEIQPLARTFDELLKTLNHCLIKMHETGYIVHFHNEKKEPEKDNTPTLLKAQVFKRVEENIFKRLVPPPPERKKNDKQRIQRTTKKKA